MADPRVIIASNRLPVNITSEGGKLALQRSVGGLATAMSSVFDRRNALWIGWSGYAGELTDSQLSLLHFPKRLTAVQLSPDLIERYYERISNGVLWPLMHGLAAVQNRTIVEADWAAVREVTRRFAQAIQAHIQPTDVIWIHDYHLLFLPQELRAAGVRNRIGFFLHTPFPRADFLLAWEGHKQLLWSLSQVDVLGFQTPRDVGRFRVSLAAAGMRMRPAAVVRDFPIGVDYAAYRTAGKMGTVKTHLNRLRAKLVGKRVILSVSRLDYTKGIIEQLYGVQQLLESLKHPERILYKLIVSPSREDVPEYRELKRDIEETVAAINARFALRGFKPIVYSYRNHGFEEVNAWFRIAHVLLVASRVDGMNLVAKEYVAARGKYGQGMMVLSETAGAAFQLKEAILVDPLDVEAIASGLYQALFMSQRERRRRWQAIRTNVKQEDVFWWSHRFLQALFGPDKGRV